MGKKKGGPIVSECGCCGHHDDHGDTAAAAPEAPLTAEPWPELDFQSKELQLCGADLRTRVQLLSGSVDPRLAQCSHLVALELSDGGITQLPASMAALSGLRSLVLSNNDIQSLPWAVFHQMSSLQALILDQNQLTWLPPSICAATNLQVLNCSGNRLRELPESLGMLRKLLEIDLGGNQFEELPLVVPMLTQLKQLRLSRNQLQMIPAELGACTAPVSYTHLTLPTKRIV
eukprot:TRINITY_DN50681_c0_g1_i2.p1 TRINITY_DN50681_c0_g1~~TRINITY_DN50681_c0_g1_i2.p1  ORF type:complete len:231 (+),score=62.58 TRINITY_DN50681_c0_g1_i2:132-824(+)